MSPTHERPGAEAMLDRGRLVPIIVSNEPAVAKPGSTDWRRRERHQTGVMARRRRDGGLVAPSSVGDAASAPVWWRAAGGSRWIRARPLADALDAGGREVAEATLRRPKALVLLDHMGDGHAALPSVAASGGIWMVSQVLLRLRDFAEVTRLAAEAVRVGSPLAGPYT